MADDILNEIRDLLDKAKTPTSKKNSVSNSDVKGLATALSKAASSSELKRLNQVYKDQCQQHQHLNKEHSLDKNQAPNMLRQFQNH